MPNLMMKDIIIGADEILYDEELRMEIFYMMIIFFNIILENYKTNDQTDIYVFWYSLHSLDLENDETPINYRNDIQLAIIKTYATDIYDTDEDDED